MVKVEYNKEACIGAGECIKLSKHFKFNNDKTKAELIDSVEKDGFHVLDVSEIDKEEVINAAKNCPVNAIRISDNEEELVGTKIKIKVIEEIKADINTYDDLKEFKMDSKGYFLIRVNWDEKRVEVGHCGERNEVDIMIYGDNALEIYMTILKKGLVTELGHAAYLGREIEKACLALKNNLKYVQDDPLDFNNKES